MKSQSCNDAFPRSWVAISPSAAVKVTSLVTLPDAGTSLSPLLAKTVVCRAARWEALLTVVPFDELLWARSCCVVSSSSEILIHSKQNYLLLKQIDCRPFGTPYRVLTAINKRVGNNVQKKFLETFLFLEIPFCITTSVRTSSFTSIKPTD